MSTADPLEITWAFITGVGLIFSIWNAVDTYRDENSVQNDPSLNGLRPVMLATARMSFRSELIRTAQLVILFLLGVGSMLRPHAQEPVATPDAYVTVLALMAMALLLMGNTAMLFISRRVLLRQLRSFDTNGHGKKEGG